MQKASSGVDEAGTSRRSRDRVRPGSRALSIFAYALNARILRAHGDGPLRLSDIVQTIGWAPPTSLRAALSNLCDLGALARTLSGEPGKGAPTELTAAGRDLLAVADRLEQWLLRAPSGPIALESPAAAGAIRALTASWDASIVRVLAEEPLTLAELDAKIEGFSYATIERRLARLRATNLVIPVKYKGRGKPYEVSEWLRRAIAPVSAAERWERRHMANSVEPISEVEVEAVFLLTVPLVSFPGDTSGRCALAVLTSPGSDGATESAVAGITLDVKGGRIVSCLPSTVSNPPTWALGTSDAWLDAVIDGCVENLRLRGAEPDLPRHIVREFHGVLFSP